MTTNEMGDAAFRIEMIGVATPLQRKLALQLLIRKDALDIAEMLVYWIGRWRRER